MRVEKLLRRPAISAPRGGVDLNLHTFDFTGSYTISL
jgi:hypothetical protein